MSAQASQLRISRVGEITQIEIIDSKILDESNIQKISDELCAVVDAEATPKVMIRFGNVEHLSSAALGALITVNNRVKGKDGTLCLSEIDSQIREVFAITKLDKIFSIFETSDEAMSSFS
jgi:anti-sigma B factor antagonist